MKNFLICMSLLLIALPVSAQQMVTEANITLAVDGGEVEGTLRAPETSGKVPVVLIISGSGPTDRDGNNPFMVNNSLKFLAEHLSEHNIASLRYDKRGIAASVNGDFAEDNLRFDYYIDDAVLWVEYLNNTGKFSEVIVAGHSEGALIGLIAAQRSDVSKYISIAGASQPANMILREQLKGQPPQVTDMALPILTQLENGQLVENVPPMLNTLFRKDVQPYLLSWMKYDPSAEIKNLNIPALIVQGTHDLQISVDDANRLAQAKPDAELVIIDGMNHVLKQAPADRQLNVSYYNRPDIALDNMLADEIINFIKD